MLEEAGEENIPTILNTLQATFPNETYQNLLAQAEAAIQGLWHLRLVSFSRDYGRANLHNVPLDESESRSALLIEDEVEYETGTSKWRWHSNSESYPIGLVLTGAGKTALTS
jgi:trehalose-6-phosphate synthase